MTDAQRGDAHFGAQPICYFFTVVISLKAEQPPASWNDPCKVRQGPPHYGDCIGSR